MSRRQSHLRAKLLLADPTCAYCGQPLAPGTGKSSSVLDHVTPRSAGGSDGSRNRALCCLPCDRRKGDLTPAALLAWAKRVAEVAERMAGAANGEAERPVSLLLNTHSDHPTAVNLITETYHFEAVEIRCNQTEPES